MTSDEHYCFGCRRHLRLINFSAIELTKQRIKQRCDKCLSNRNIPHKTRTTTVKPYCNDHINFIQGNVDV